jgi:hypothetical protein
MSDYRVIWPDDVLDAESDASANVEPAILQFRLPAPKSSHVQMDVITRARLLFENRTCPACGYAVVSPIELNDHLVNRNRLPIPGTATLVGFHCCGCGAEWSV